MNKKVSLYIPCYNAEATLAQCLEAVFSQSYSVDEILIVDDGSTDNTLSIVKKHPIKVISLDKNYGLAYSRNIACREAKNGFLASLDADCLADKDWLEHMMREFEADNTEDIVGVGGRLIESDVKTVIDTWRTLHMRQDWGELQLINPPFLSGSNTVFRRDIVKELGAYWPKYKTNYEDVDLSERILCCGYTLIYIPEAVVRHQKRDTITSLIKGNQRRNYYLYDNIFNNKKLFCLKLKIYRDNFISNVKIDLESKNISLLWLSIIIFTFIVWEECKSFIKKMINDTNNI